jgi:hypothetical protein
LELDVEIEGVSSGPKLSMQVLLDCGAMDLFLNMEYVCKHDIPTHKLQRPIPVFNVDGSPNEAGSISKIADTILQHKDHLECVTLKRNLNALKRKRLPNASMPVRVDLFQH